MGEIADMMLDGTMDPETGEFNFDGEDGPGWPMTGADAEAYKRAGGWPDRAYRPRQKMTFRANKKCRKMLAPFGELTNLDPYHFRIRRDGRTVADWYPHRHKWVIRGQVGKGNEYQFAAALKKLGDESRT